jgi:hypothetical protein
LGTEKCARSVDVHDSLPFFGFDIEDVLTAYDACETAENVDPLQQRCSLLCSALDAGGIRDINAHLDHVGLKIFVEGITRFDVIFAFEL